MGLGIGDALAGVAGVGLDVAGTFLQDRLNTRGAREQRDWEEGMYRNRYQMQVADLKAAGLNPMLAYGQGPGGVPSGSAASVSKPDIASSFNASRSTSAQVANINQDTMKKIAEKENIETDTLVKSGMVDSVAAMTVSHMASAEQAYAQAEQIRAAIPKIEAEINVMATQAAKNKEDANLAMALQRAQQFLNSLHIAQEKLAGKETELKQQDITLKNPRVKAYEESAPKDLRLQGHIKRAGDVMQDFYRMINPFYNFMGGGK